MGDEMFFSDDMRSLRRGKRVARRTETCRPCLVWTRDLPETQHYGVIMDMTPYGLRVRMMAEIGPGADIVIQLMRDDDFLVPFSKPIEASVTRTQQEANGFTDHGVRLLQEAAKRAEPKPMEPRQKPAARRRRPRMYTLDVTLGERRRRRSGR